MENVENKQALAFTIFIIVRIYLDNCCYYRPFDDQADIVDYTKWQENLMEDMSVR